MTTQTRQRGRPKGTGLDDTSQLKAIAALLSQSRGMKPTTAIKSFGITNPSTIRRLRDKFNLVRDELMAEIENKKHHTHLETDSQFDDNLAGQIGQTTHTAETAAGSTCALAMPVGPALTEKRKRKTATKDKKKKPGKKSQLAKDNIDAAPIAKPKSKKQAPPKPARQPVSSSQQEADDIVSSWLALCAQYANCTIETQLSVLQMIGSPDILQRAAQFQAQTVSSWMRIAEYNVSAANSLHGNFFQPAKRS